jgi:hypothetical protein
MADGDIRDVLRGLARVAGREAGDSAAVPAAA